MIIEEEKYKIQILVGSDGLNAQDDNVDIEVIFDSDKRYIATFFTINNIERLLKGYEISGECARGSYFWASDMVIVRDLTIECIRNTIADLVNTGEIIAAFSGPVED